MPSFNRMPSFSAFPQAAPLDQKTVLEQYYLLYKIRQFETRAEATYQEALVGGFFHSYAGQEAIQTAAVLAIGQENYWVTSYRCHALAILLGASSESLFAELLGRKSGNALGRGGSMHFFTERLLGGFGIVGGQLPIALGAAFTIQYLRKSQEMAVCFLGDGAVAQGTFHESLNLAVLWKLPCLFVIENNQWGMGTHVKRAVSVEAIAEKKAPSFGMKGYTLDGMDFFSLYDAFTFLKDEILTRQEPILIEVKTERFKGHSISDSEPYRTKAQLQECVARDPLKIFAAEAIRRGLATEEQLKEQGQRARQEVVEALKKAKEAPWPDPSTLEEDVFFEGVSCQSSM